MRIACDNDRFILICNRDELGLIAEGLFAVSHTGRRSLEQGIPDEFDAPVLREELYLLDDMRAQVDAALG